MNNAILPASLYQIIDRDIYFIDIRDTKQFDNLHIKNFKNIQPENLFSYVSTLSLNKPICLMCYSGKKAENLVKELIQRGYSAYYVLGGFQAFLNIQNNKYF